jgi:hypothetical protein
MKINKSTIKDIIKETMSSGEDVQEIESLLRTISDKLDTLSDIDISIDTLTGVMAGTDPAIVDLGQTNRGRFGLDVAHARDIEESKGSTKMKINKSTIKAIVKEMMTSGVSYGQGMGIGHPNTANAVEISGGPGAPVVGWPEIDEIKGEVTKRVMHVLKDFVHTTGDAYELLVVIVKELEDKMATDGYVEDESELEQFYPLQERRKRSKRSS